MNRYPYPVLCNSNSSYNQDISFDISYINHRCSSGMITFKFAVSNNSKTIDELLQSSNARCLLKMQTGIFTITKECELSPQSIELTIPSEKIKRNDELKITCFVVANCDFILKHSPEMIDIYADDYEVSLNKNDVLAISNTVSLSYNTSNNDFIKFEISEEMTDKGYKISFGSNYIAVKVSPAFNESYGLLKNNNANTCSIFNSHLVFEVFVYTLIHLIQQEPDSDDFQTEWYSLFEQLFLQTNSNDYDSFEEFSSDVNDQGNISIELIYEAANRMISNQIEKSLIHVSRIQED